MIQDGEILSFNPDVSISMKTLGVIARKSKIVPKRQKNQLKGRA